MAVVGNFKSLENMFYKTPALNALSEYLTQALDTNSAVYKRILNTDEENKITLSDGMFAIEQSYGLKDISIFLFLQ